MSLFLPGPQSQPLEGATPLLQRVKEKHQSTSKQPRMERKNLSELTQVLQVNLHLFVKQYVTLCTFYSCNLISHQCTGFTYAYKAHLCSFELRKIL